jgi:hypothetical protein
MIEPAAIQATRNLTGMSRHILGNAAARGTAGLHCLELMAVGNAAADDVNDFAKLEMPMGTSTRPVF